MTIAKNNGNEIDARIASNCVCHEMESGIDRVEANVIDLMVGASEQVLCLVDGNLRERMTRGDLTGILGKAGLDATDSSGSESAIAMLRDNNGTVSRLAPTADPVGGLCTAAANIAADDHRNRQALREGSPRP